jgi:DNA polymerase-3 subunit epsilon
LVNCGVRIPSYITAYTGITQGMVDAAPTVGVVLREMLTFVGHSTVVAHGAQFDQRFFVNECRHASLSPATLPPFLCSLQLARRVHPTLDCHSLGALAHKLALPVAGLAHRASADAEVTAQLVLSLAHELARTYPGLVIDAELLRRLMHSPLAITTAGAVGWAPLENLPPPAARLGQVG